MIPVIGCVFVVAKYLALAASETADLNVLNDVFYRGNYVTLPCLCLKHSSVFALAAGYPWREGCFMPLLGLLQLSYW